MKSSPRNSPERAGGGEAAARLASWHAEGHGWAGEEPPASDDDSSGDSDDGEEDGGEGSGMRLLRFASVRRGGGGGLYLFSYPRGEGHAGSCFVSACPPS